MKKASWKLQLPRSRAGRIATATVGGWAVITVGALMKQTIAPTPTSTIRRDFSAASEWIETHRTKYGALPSREAFRRFLLRTASVVSVEYHPTDAGTYTLGGWDGDNRWRFLPRSGNIVRDE